MERVGFPDGAFVVGNAELEEGAPLLPLAELLLPPTLTTMPFPEIVVDVWYVENVIGVLLIVVVTAESTPTVVAAVQTPAEQEVTMVVEAITSLDDRNEPPNVSLDFAPCPVVDL